MAAIRRRKVSLLQLCRHNGVSLVCVVSIISHCIRIQSYHTIRILSFIAFPRQKHSARITRVLSLRHAFHQLVTLGCLATSFISSLASEMKMGITCEFSKAVYLGATGSITCSTHKNSNQIRQITQKQASLSQVKNERFKDTK